MPSASMGLVVSWQPLQLKHCHLLLAWFALSRHADKYRRSGFAAGGGFGLPRCRFSSSTLRHRAATATGARKRLSRQRPSARAASEAAGGSASRRCRARPSQSNNGTSRLSAWARARRAGTHRTIAGSRGSSRQRSPSSDARKDSGSRSQASRPRGEAGRTARSRSPKRFRASPRGSTEALGQLVVPTQ